MKITITGDIGSGKTSIGKLLAEKLGYLFYSVGESIESLSSVNNMSLDEFLSFIRIQNVDLQFDEYVQELSKCKFDSVIDGKMAWYFSKESLDIYLTCDIDIAIKRKYKITDEQLEQAKSKLIERNQLELNRYNELYNVDSTDENNYNLFIDTTHKSKEQVVDEILGILQLKEVS